VASEEESVSPPFVKPFEIRAPRGSVGSVVYNSPHSGRVYPSCLTNASRLDQRGLRRSEDFMMDAVMERAPELGFPLLVANFPRAYLDVNREPYELDPRMFDGRLPSFANTRSLRVAGGLGTIPKIVGDGQDIYRARLPVAEALLRIEQIYKPYHAALRALLNAALSEHGEAILVDCHSMPSASLGPGTGDRADIVLGDRFGVSCAPQVIAVAEEVLQGLGFRVTRNRPYAGGFITEHYGQPQAGVHALQVEVNRSLYMDEAAIEPHAGFERMRDAMSRFIERFGSAVAGMTLGPLPMAAE
jgi:N-formylglutamate amidohydrolase